MKNLRNLKGSKMLSRNDQKEITGGKTIIFHPCGPTGGMTHRSSSAHDSMQNCFIQSGNKYVNGVCWICY